VSANAITAAAAVVAPLATVIIAGVTLRQQRRLSEQGIAEQRRLSEQGIAEQLRLTERGIAEQRKSAREQRIWDTRADLYVNLLVWLAGKSADIQELLTEVRKQRNDLSLREIVQLFDDAHERLLTARTSPSATSPGVHAGNTAPPSPDPGQAGVMALWRLLEPPVELREQLLLYASVEVRAALEKYKAEAALPMVAGDEVDALIFALETSPGALDRFRNAIIAEIDQFTSTL
jgi:hypothetical protein